MMSTRLACAGLLVATLAARTGVGSTPPPSRDLTLLSLTELADVEVTSVSRHPEKLSSAAAAVFVITQEDIRRLGITTLADALRLAPGVQVSRINANQWAVGVRGFTSSLSRALLVLVDGRSTYTPLFAGTYWDVMDTLLEDLDRIEVIRGPGGTLWGSNAVNGVINIITRKASETKGAFVQGGGTDAHGFAAARWGARAGSVDFRVYAKTFDRGGFFHPDGDDYDSWRMTQGGFHANWAAGGGDAVTLQGDVYSGAAGQRTLLSSYVAPFAATVHTDAHLSGGNAVARWEHAGDRSGMAVQAYFDRTTRTTANFSEARSTFDLDIQDRFRLGSVHEIVCGLGARSSRGETGGIPTVTFTPADRTDRLFSAFVQDTIEVLAGRLRVIIGTKIEHNDYSGTEVQPNVRVVVAPDDRHNLWAAVSRAVRTPTRVDADLTLTQQISPGPVFFRVQGEPEFRAEEVVAFEIGYRVRPAARLWVDLAIFYNRYRNLLSLEPGAATTIPGVPGIVIPSREANGLEGRGTGGELVVGYQVSNRWHLRGSYSRLSLDVNPSAGSLDTTSASSTEGSTARELLVLRSSLDLPAQITFDTFLRAAGPLPAQQVPGYASLDARLAWSPAPIVELSVTGRSLLQSHHLEFAGGPASTEVPRSVFGEVRLRW